MTLDTKDAGSPGNPATSRLAPPYHLERNFLAETTVAALLEFAAANEARFENSTLYDGTRDPSIRVSSILRGFGALEDEIDRKVRALVPTLVGMLRMSPFEIAKTEIELAAHGDGAFYTRHIDTVTGSLADPDTVRFISGVYYFHAEPKAFSGGELRLHDFARDGQEPEFVDIEPARNMLLTFPSWAQHEVRPIVCPTRHFMDSRFAINCWVHGKRKRRGT